MSFRTATSAALLALATLAPAAHAQLFRAYLAPYGNDANSCQLATPCRLLPAALNAVQDGGEIWILDSANYNTAPVGITKSVKILAVPGALGSVVATGGNAIDISTPGVKVALRNLVIVPLPGTGGNNGISMTAGSSLTLEQCVVAGLPGSGVVVTGGASVRVVDSTFRDNAAHGLYVTGGAGLTVTRAVISGNGIFGIGVNATAGTTTVADIADSTIDGNSQGVVAGTGDASAIVTVSVKDSRVVRNQANGIVAQSIPGGPLALSASGNMVANNGGYGILSSFAGSKVWAVGNTVSGNFAGLVNDGATFESAGNNAVRNNTIDASGTITVVATQ